MRIEDQRHVVVVGSDHGWLAEMGLQLARRLHRPFLDCGLIGLDSDDVEPVEAQDRLDRMLTQPTPSVIAISVDDELSIQDRHRRDEMSRPWVIAVDRSAATVVELGGDVDVDMRIDQTGEVEDELLDHLAEEFHRARPHP